MPKTGRYTGPSKGDGTQAPVVEERGGIDLQLLGSNADLVVKGVATFASSPQVPYPTSPTSTTGAASKGEVQDLINAEPALDGAGTIFFGSFGTVPGFGQKIVGNTNVETSLLGSTHTVPAMGIGSTARVVIGGDLRNSSGGAITLTFRFKVAGSALFTLAPSIPNDANTRPYRFEVDLHNIGGGFANISGQLSIAAGAGAASFLLPGINPIQTQGGTSQAWDVSAQWASANANATMERLTATLWYTVGT